MHYISGTLVAQILTAILMGTVIGAIVLWSDTKRSKLQTWQIVCWMVIFVGLPFFISIPLYLLLRPLRQRLNDNGQS